MREGHFGDSTNRQATLEIDASDTNEQSYSEKLHLISNIAHEELKGVDFSDPLIRYRYYEEALLAMNSISSIESHFVVDNKTMGNGGLINGGITKINRERERITDGLDSDTRFDFSFNKIFKTLIDGSTSVSDNVMPWSYGVMKYMGPDLSDDQLLAIQKALIISDLYLSSEIGKKSFKEYSPDERLSCWVDLQHNLKEVSQEIENKNLSESLTRYNYYNAILPIITSIQGIGNDLFIGNEPINKSRILDWRGDLTRILKTYSSNTASFLIDRELLEKYPIIADAHLSFYDNLFLGISQALIFGGAPSWKEFSGTDLPMTYRGKGLSGDQLAIIQEIFFVSTKFQRKNYNAEVFSRVFSLEDEQQTGFEPEEFLSTANKEKFESQTEKLETFKTKFSEQLHSLDSLYKNVEALPSDVSAPLIIQGLMNSPEYQLLSKEQKFNFKKGICALVDRRENLTAFLEENEELDAKSTIAKLRNIDSTHFKGFIEMERNDCILNFYVENKEDYDYIKTKGLQQESSSGGFQTELYEGFPLVVTFIGDQSKESIEEFDIHEKRHARDRMIMKKEETRAFEGIKLEFLAYLEDGSSWKNILYYLTRDDGYTYGLEGEAWKQHKEYVRSLVDILKDCDCKNHLDTLAVLPLAKWPFAARYLIPKIPEPIVETQEPQRSEPIVEKQELQKVEEKATEKKSSGFIHLVSKFFRSL